MSRARWVAREIGPALAGVAGLVVIWAVVAALVDSSSLPSPLEVWRAFLDGLRAGTIQEAAAKTLIRLAFSFAVAIAIGTAIGFGLSERAVVFVAIVGSFPAVTLGTISAFRQVPPLWRRAGMTLGAQGWALYRSVIFPAALPGYVAGLQQAWGFAWKSLMAGELIVAGVQATGLGQLLAQNQQDVPALLAAVAVIVAIGTAVDYLVFNQLDRRIRTRRGLLVQE